jgi:hypothetical protein
MANPHPVYDAHIVQRREINALALAREPRDWPTLAQKLDSALADPNLPLHYRAGYHAFRAQYGDPSEHLTAAKELLWNLRETRDTAGVAEDEVKVELHNIGWWIATAEQDAARTSFTFSARHKW